MFSATPNSSEPSTDLENPVNFSEESEPINLDSPNSFILENTDDNTGISESPGTSSSETTRRTAEEAGLNTISDDEEVGSSKKSKDTNEDEETAFASLIDNGLLKLIESKNLQSDNIREGIAAIKDAFRYDLGHRYSNIDFKKPENICAFLYLYGPFAAGLTRFRTLQALNKCSALLHRLAASSSINIISLGSGPGCDIIGLCSALYEHVRYQRVKLTLVDSVKGWLSAFNIIEFLTREGEFGNASRLFKDSDVSTTFLRADLSDETEDEVYLSALQEADVIMICKLFSILKLNQIEKVKKTVAKTMKVGAVLLLIDSPDYPIKNLTLIYKSLTPADYFFQGKVVEERFLNPIARHTTAQIKIYTKLSAE